MCRGLYGSVWSVGEAREELRKAELEDVRAQRELAQRQTAFLEGCKLHHEWFKTQTTLTTGAIVAITAIVQGLLPSSLTYLFLLWGAYGGLLLSMITSLSAMSVLINNVYKMPDLSKRSTAENRAQNASWWFFGLVSTLSFSGGIVAFVVFAGLNLFGQ